MSARVYPRGFTIVEVLIVLAISGVIMVATLPFISNKQNNTQFTVGIRQIQNQLQEILNNVSTGNVTVPASVNYSCTSSNGAGPVITSTLSNLGTNFGCQYIGMGIYFDKNSMQIIPIIGQKYSDSNLTKVTSLASAKPCPMIFVTNGCSQVNGATTINYPSSITMSKYSNTIGTGLVAIYSITSISSDVSNGSGGVDLLNLGLNALIGTGIPNSGNILASTYNLPIDICFNSGTNSNSGVIHLSPKGNPTSVDLDIGSVKC
ncbi:type II secretion system protein [bacterium]|nr:type II secretion system protein [bacterium]